ncbi:hypothetical protein POF51_29680 [Brevibacillus sp. AG]|uniref:hypothetical protein n=1 Tax=Brevibacillus sp. AG TaxID=3020891 RepID=UPI00232D459C|nr:hypothetical protein [Brevibacillus sp. AG]MDC0764895.1 hypothetical protein [Brevibacillus sp. AG]
MGKQGFRKAYTCPSGCEIEHILICGGNGQVDKDNNVYFQATLDGLYTNRLEDGTIGVTEDHLDHADGGCCNEPICPECRSQLVKGLPILELQCLSTKKVSRPECEEVVEVDDER